MKYSSFREQIKTGDIFLFSGKGNLSEIIKSMTHSDYSHIGMAIASREQDAVFLWESTTLSNVADIETGLYTKGVQLVPLSDRMAKYGGDIHWQQLNNSLEDWRLKNLWKFRKEVSGRPYERKKLNLIASLFRPYAGDEDLSSLFCSELAAEALQRMEMLLDVDKDGRPSDKYTPHDLSVDGGINVHLMGGFEYRSPILVT